MNIRILKRSFGDISIINNRNEIVYTHVNVINSDTIETMYFNPYFILTPEEIEYIKNNVNNLPVINIIDYKNEFYFNNFSSREDVIDLLLDNNIDFIHHFNANSMTVIKTREPLSDSIVTMMKLLGV